MVDRAGILGRTVGIISEGSVLFSTEPVLLSRGQMAALIYLRLGLLLKLEEVDCVQVSGYNMFTGNLGGVATVWDISSQVN